MKNFIRGAIIDELQDIHIFAYKLTNEYAARVLDLPSYDAISKDIIHRWTFPLVPDTNFMNSTQYRYMRGCQYRDSDTELALTCSIGQDTVLGSGCIVGEGTQITKSVIGSDCIIGAHCIIEGSYLWKGVVIEDHTVVRNSMLCDGVHLEGDVTVSSGSLLSFNVRVGANQLIPEASKITCLHASEIVMDDGDFFEEDPTSPILTPERPISSDVNGKGYYWQADSYEMDILFNTVATLSKAALRHQRRISLLSTATQSQDTSFTLDVSRILGESDSDDSNSDLDPQGLAWDQETLDLSPAKDPFVEEVMDTIIHGAEESVSTDNIALEINGLKYAHDSTFSDCCSAILMALFTYLSPGTSLQSSLKAWVPLLSRYLRGDQEQLETVLMIEEYCLEHVSWTSYFQLLLQLFYDWDLIPEESILKWATLREESPEDEQRMLQLCKPFLVWLREAEEESDEDAS